MLRYQSGKSAKLPFTVQVQMVAARYGTTPEKVRDWPADDFILAVQLLGVTGGG